MTIFKKEKEDTNIIICSNGKKKIHRKQHILTKFWAHLRKIKQNLNSV